MNRIYCMYNTCAICVFSEIEQLYKVVGSDSDYNIYIYIFIYIYICIYIIYIYIYILYYTYIYIYLYILEHNKCSNMKNCS